MHYKVTFVGKSLAQNSVCATLFARAALCCCSCVFAIQFGNKTGADLGRANRLTFIRIGAIAESLCIHDVDHSQYTTFSFRVTLG